MTSIILPLVIAVPSASSLGQFDNPNDPSLQVQMDTLGGQTYLVPLNASAAKALLVTLANWPPMQDFLSKPEPPGRPKLQ